MIQRVADEPQSHQSVSKLDETVFFVSDRTWMDIEQHLQRVTQRVATISGSARTMQTIQKPCWVWKQASVPRVSAPPSLVPMRASDSRETFGNKLVTNGPQACDLMPLCQNNAD